MDPETDVDGAINLSTHQQQQQQQQTDNRPAILVVDQQTTTTTSSIHRQDVSANLNIIIVPLPVASAWMSRCKYLHTA